MAKCWWLVVLGIYEKTMVDNINCDYIVLK